MKLKKLTKTEPKKSDIASRIKPLAETDLYLTMLAYGKSGTGKTVFSGSWPKPLLLLDIREKGHESIVDVDGIDLLPIERWSDLEEVYWDVLDKKDKYRSVVLDQLTAMQALGMQHLKDEKSMKPSEPFSQRAWGQLSGMMQTWIHNYRELYSQGYHVCFNAHERLRDAEETDDERIAPSVGSNLMQSVSSFVNGAVSVIGNTFIREVVDKKEKTKEIQYCMRVGAHAYYAAKLRRPVSAGPTPDVIVNPTFDKIIKLSRGESLQRKVKKV